VRLLRGGDELFPRLIEAIGQALHEVWLATYIFYDDSAAEAVAWPWPPPRGAVRVRVVVDGFGSHRSLPTLQRWLEPAGVHFTVFRPLERWWNWLQPGQMRRLHQKLCVVDGQRAFVGGINLIDDRNDIHHGRSERPRLDFAAEVHGPAAMPVEQTVRAIWTRAAFGEDWRQEVLNLVRSARRCARPASTCGSCASCRRTLPCRRATAPRCRWPSSCATTCASAGPSSAA
jgi:cardiolipin synthase